MKKYLLYIMCIILIRVSTTITAEDPEKNFKRTFPSHVIQEDLLKNLTQIREQKPLIHHLTNYVTMDFIANGVLALGASPIMSHGAEELDEMVKIASCVVINIGTLDEHWLPRFKKALSLAKELKKPVILDPVGAGATSYRTQTALDLLSQGGISIIKGNASEIMALAGEQARTKGVDSQNKVQEAVSAAKLLTEKFHVCVVVTGKDDVICAMDRHREVGYGSPFMSKVTGMGCLLASVIGSFHAIEKDAFKAASQAVMLFKMVGTLAEKKDKVEGPASFKVEFIDLLHNIDADKIKQNFKEKS